MSTLESTNAKTPSFEQDARRTLRAVCDSFADVVEAATGRIPNAAEFCRLLKIDKKLGWKISKVVQTTDVFAVVPHIPGSAGVGIFLDAAAHRGASEPLIERAREAFTSFERLISTHAGDRQSLEMMARGFVEETSEQAELNHRRDAYFGHSYTWGVQARTQLSANIIFPSSKADWVDIVLLSGLIDLRRLRPKVAWVVARLGFVGASGEPHVPAPGTLLPSEDIPLLSKFCSDPPPQLRKVVSPSGYIEIELDDGPVGDSGAMTCIFCGEAIREAGSRFRTEDDPNADLNVHVRTPSKALVHDLIVHRDIFGQLEPTAAVFSEVHHEVKTSRLRDDRYRLPVPLAAEYLGQGASALRTPDVPRYPEMARHVLRRENLDPDEFDVYRIRMQYPIVPTSVTMSFDLLPRP
ncbi:MAG: hypothetical protein ACYTJ0_13430 [Planctomycetota bacterium]